MDKYVIPLFVIAVMFTFSFGSAFAVSKAEYNDTLAKTYFDSAMKAIKESVAGGITLTGDNTYAVDYETLAANYDAIYDAVVEFVKGADSEDYVGKVGDMGMTHEINRIAYIINQDTELQMDLVAEQYAADKADAIAILNSLSAADYSTAELSAALKSALNADCTYQEYVEKLISDAINEINKASFNSDSTVDAYADAKVVIDGYFDAAAQADASTKLVVEKYYTGANNAVIGLGVYQLNADYVVTGTTTLAQFKATYIAGEAAVDAANVAAVKAAVATGYADYMRGENADAAKAAIVKDMLDFLAEEGVWTSTSADSAKYYITTATAANVNAAVTQVAELEAVAAQLAAEVDSTGALVRDAEDVADIVTAGTIAAYQYALGRSNVAYDAATYEGQIEDLYTTLDDEKLAYMKKQRETAIADFLAATVAYYPAEIAELNEIFDAYMAKVNAVTACSKVDDYDSQLENDVNAVLTKDEVNDKSAVDSLKNVADQYVDFLNNQITKEANKYYVEGNNAKLNAEIEKLVGNSDARTTAAINALSEDVLALVKALPTNAEVEVAEEAADAAVKVLPTTVKTTDKAVIDAAIVAVDAYEALAAADYDNTGAISTAVTKYAYAYLNEMTAKVKAVDKADKAAVEALIDEFEAFVDEYEDYTDTDLEAIFDNQVDKLEGYLDAIKAEAASAVRKAIAAIPVKANITAADEAKVAAARAAYDAYVADYTDYREDYVYTVTTTADGFVADDFDYAALAGAETLLGMNTEDAAYSVEALKITAKSSAKKGSITVKWTVEGDTDAVEAYEIWRSTKKNSGFKKMFTTEKTSYKNTKNLKKGTRYYFKVRAIAYTAEGEKVKSDWSNKAYRIAK